MSQPFIASNTFKTAGRFKAEVIADSSGTWAGNALRFDTIDAAKSYAIMLATRWVLVRAWRVVDTEDHNTVVAESA